MEGGFLKTPFVNIGNRQKNRERGDNVIDTTYNKNNIYAAISRALSKRFQQKVARGTSPYSGGDVAKKAVAHIEKYLYETKKQENKRGAL